MMITLVMDADDFDRLTDTAASWASSMTSLWGPVLGRFEPYSGGKDPVKDAPGLHWQWIHWTGQDYASLLLARAYLASNGYPFEVVYDTSELGPDAKGMTGWALLTDYSPLSEHCP